MRTTPITALVVCALLAGQVALAQDTGTPPGTPPGADAKKPFSQEQLDQMLAPIALYPDDLLAQVLMASTYPLEVVQCDRWLKVNRKKKPEEQAKLLEEEEWEASVKSLVTTPTVLAMMSEKLDWCEKLGDAFIAQQKEVLDTIQMLRRKAKDQGNLNSSQEQTVEATTETIIIQSSSPDTIYVPVYDPGWVYGTWWHPYYPPYPYYPYGCHPAHHAMAFGAGVAVGVAWGYAMGHCNWHGGDVDIDINKNVNRNTNIDRSKYGNGQNKGKWQHQPEHRGNIPYRDNATAKQYGGQSRADAAKTRQGARGRAEASLGSGASASARDRSGTGSRDRSGLDGVDRGSKARDYSERGRTSRGTSTRSNPRPARTPSTSGGARSGGGGGTRTYGGSRGGGGGGRGGGGGGRGGGGRGR